MDKGIFLLSSDPKKPAFWGPAFWFMPVQDKNSTFHGIGVVF
jgi:hypothetical protein